MNILIVSHLYYPTVGGVQVAVSNLIKQYLKKGHRVELITTRWPKTLTKTEYVDGVKVTRLPFRLPSLNPVSLVKFSIQAFMCLWNMYFLARRAKFDIINLHYVSENALYALMLSYFMHIPLVTNIHGSDIQLFALRGKFNKWVVKQCLKRSDQVIANSNALLEVTLKLFGSKNIKNPVVIGNGVDLLKIDQSNNPYSSLAPFILGIGRLEYFKGFDVLVKAFAAVKKRFPAVRLIIVGEGSEMGKLEVLRQDLALYDSVSFYGRLEHKDVLKMLDACEFLVMPSRREAFGIVIIEAMATGKAVIATNVGGIPELVTNGKNGILVQPDDPNSIACAIATLIQDDQLSKKLGKFGMKNVKENFDWEQVSKKYLELLNGIVLSHH